MRAAVPEADTTEDWENWEDWARWRIVMSWIKISDLGTHLMPVEVKTVIMKIIVL